ncbi:zinc finger, CCHC-type containing protein [Tanacetum coccineum]
MKDSWLIRPANKKEKGFFSKEGMTGETSKKDEGGMSMTFPLPDPKFNNYTNWGVTLPEQLTLQVAHHTNAADIWKDLKARFVGIDKVKEARLQTLESEFETLKMKDSESLDEFTGKISQLVSQASNLGSTIENKRLVRKLLGSVPTKFIQIVAAIEQFVDLNTMTFQEATGRLKAYEERIKRPSKEEDVHDRLLYTKTVEKEQEKQYSCERCGYRKSNQDNKGRSRERNWNKDGNQLQKDKSHIKCFKCNKFGHYKHECTRKEEEVNFAQYEDDEPVVVAPLL